MDIEQAHKQLTQLLTALQLVLQEYEQLQARIAASEVAEREGEWASEIKNCGCGTKLWRSALTLKKFTVQQLQKTCSVGRTPVNIFLERAVEIGRIKKYSKGRGRAGDYEVSQECLTPSKHDTK